MKKNVGSTEKTIRIILGVVIILVGIFTQSWWGLIGIVPLVTGLINYCPVWSLFGISTQKKVDTEKIKV